MILPSAVEARARHALYIANSATVQSAKHARLASILVTNVEDVFPTLLVTNVTNALITGVATNVKLVQ